MIATLVAVCAVVVAASAAWARTPAFASGFLSIPALSGARLSGIYAVSGEVTNAVGIPGESAGQRVSRWTFVSPCRSGACSTLGLRRQRASGTDALFLRRLAPWAVRRLGQLSGSGPVPWPDLPGGGNGSFQLLVIVTAAAPGPGGGPVATGFTATYTGDAHVGHTGCIQPPVHDAAAYSGILTGS